MDTSRRVITKEERRLLFHYFTLGPPTPLENTSSCEDAPSGACTPSGTSTAPGHGDGREAGGFSRKDLVHSSSDDEEAGKAQGGHPMNATVLPRDGPLGGSEGSVPTRGETRAVESETRRGGRRPGSALQKLFSRPRPHGIDVMESTEAGARGQQHPDTAAVGEIVDGGWAGDAFLALLCVMLWEMSRQDDNKNKASGICAGYTSREKNILSYAAMLNA